MAIIIDVDPGKFKSVVCFYKPDSRDLVSPRPRPSRCATFAFWAGSSSNF